MILTVLEKLSEKPLIFKGGTALMLCYGIDRFSEDLDFDCQYNVSANSLKNLLSKVADVEIKKDTETTKRFKLSTEEVEYLKVEISLRKYKPSYPLKKLKDNLYVYDINDLFLQKLNALSNRGKARDLYDIAFICYQYYNKLSSNYRKKIYNLFASKDEIYNLIPKFIDAFNEDKMLTDEDLLISVNRLILFYKKVEKDLKNLKVERKNF